jgi:hypothetical protein
MRTPVALVALAAALLAFPATATADPRDPINRFCAIADGPIVQLICALT